MVILFTIGNDPDFRLDFTNKLEAIKYSPHLQLVGHDVEQIGKSFMKNWGGNPYTIEDGIDDSYIFMN